MILDTGSKRQAAIPPVIQEQTIWQTAASDLLNKSFDLLRRALTI
jgi:hypothetical protein